MFPNQITSPITIYPTYTDRLTGNQINIRCVLQNCFWNDDSISVFQRTGVQTANSVTLFIPYAKEVTGRQYISPDEWNNLAIDQLDKYWTANPRQLSLMVKGIFTHEFYWASPSDSRNRIAQQESDLMLQNVGIVLRARDVNTQLFGSAEMWHIQIRA